MNEVVPQPDRIPFNKPFIAGKELYYIAQAVTYGNIGGDGHFTQLCSEFFERRFGIAKVLMTPSCTAALEIAAQLCDLQPGDEVIMPSFTFVSTANAAVRCGARPRFVDIRPDTLNLDECQIEAACGERTRAIFPVHYAGVACEMEPILEIARRRGLRVVEDAAQGVNAAYRGQPLGSLGDLATFSFHETKNYICGEGGALCINDPALIERAEIIRDKGTNRKQFIRGMVDKYTWVDVGSSHVPSEIVCAFLYAQLQQMESITERRRQIDAIYRQGLMDLQDAGILRLPTLPEDRQTNFHMCYILLNSESERNQLLEHLRQRQIQAVFHYIPLHLSKMGGRWGYRHGMLPVTEDLSGRLLRLPFYHEIRPEEQQRVIREIHLFFRQECR
jgi:dTDP-4-amino-4,6-dideoxygalactose transaminase